MATRVNTRFVLILSTVLVSLTLTAIGFWYVFVYRNADRLVRWADDYAQQEQYREAAEMYGKAIAKKPREVKVLYKWADASSKVRCNNLTESRLYFQDMQRAYNQCILVQPDNPEHVERLMGLYLDSIRDGGLGFYWYRMNSVAQGILDNQPNHELAKRYHSISAVRIMRGSAMGMPQREAVREHLTDLYGRDPADAEIANALARWYLEQSRDLQNIPEEFQRDQYKQMANQISEEFLRVDPTDIERQLNRAHILAALEMDEEAMQTANRLEQALLTTSGEAWVIREVASLLESVDKRPAEVVGFHETTQGVLRAIKLIQAALVQYPENIVLKSLLARLYHRQGDLAAALETYKTIYQTDFLAPPIQAQLVGLLARQAGYKWASLMVAEAERLPDEAAREARLVEVEVLLNEFKDNLAEDDPEIALTEGKIHMIRNQWAQASQRLDDASSMNRDSNVEALFLSGVARKQTGQLGAAEARFKRVLELAPTYHTARFELARLQMKINRLTEAKFHVEYLREHHGDDPKTHLLFAQYLENAGRSEEAVQLIESMNPGDDPNLLVTVSKLYQSMGESGRAIEMLETYFKRDPTEPRILLQLVDMAPSTEAKRQYIEQARAAGATLKAIDVAEKKIAFDEGRLEEVINIVEDPFARATAFFDLYLRQGELRKATEQLEVARKLQPDDPKVVSREFELAMVRQDDAAMLAAVGRAEKTNADLAQGLLYRGQYEYIKGDLNRASSTLAEAVARRPVHSEGHRMLGDVQLRLGRVSDAVESYQKAIAQNPRNARAQLGMAQVMSVQQHPTEALDYIRRAADLGAGSPAIMQAYLDFEERHGDREVALKKRLELVEANPDETDNQRGLAQLYGRMQQYDKALATIDALIGREGMNWKNAQTKANILYVSGNAQGGRSLLQDYVTGLGEDAKSEDWVLMARYLRTIGDVNAALAAYRMGMQFDNPDAPIAQSALARLLMDLQRFDDAMEQYDSLIQKLPDNVTIASDRIETMMRMGRIDEAEKALNASLARVGQQTPLLLHKALALELRMLQAGQANESSRLRDLRSELMALLNRTVESDPNNAEALFRRARLLAQSRETLDAALEDATKAVEIKADLGRARVLMAKIHAQRGNDDAAANELRALLSVDENNQDARESLYELLLRNRKTAEAKKLLTEAVELFPSDFRWWVYRAIVARDLEQSDDTAITHFSRALELAPSPQNAQVLEEMIRLMLDGGRTDDALSMIDQHMSIVNQRLLLQAMRARALAYQGDTDSATNLFANLLPACKQLNHARALASEMRKAFDAQGTIQRLEAVAQGEQQKRWVQLIGADYDVTDQNYERALQRLESMDSTAMERPGLESHLYDLVEAVAALNLGQSPRAAKAYQRVIEVSPDDVSSLNNLAYILAEDMGKPGEALPFAERAKDLARNDPQVLDTVGWVQYKAGRKDEAFLTLRRSVELKKLSDNCFHLAKLHIERGSIGEARNLLNDAEKLALAEARQDLLPEIRALKEQVRRSR